MDYPSLDILDQRIKRYAVDASSQIFSLNFDVNMADCHGYTALHFAIKYRKPHLALYLITQGANPNASTPDGVKVAHLTPSGGNRKIKLFIAKPHATRGGPLDSPARAILLAAASGDLKRLETLKSKFGASKFSETKDHGGRSPLHVAACLGHTEACVLLISDFKINVDIPDVFGFSPLHLAVLAGQFETALTLIHYSTDAMALTISGLSVLDLIFRSGSMKIMDLFTEFGVPHLPRDSMNRPKVICSSVASDILDAACFGHLEKLKTLHMMIQGAVVSFFNVKDNRGRTPLHLAASNGHMDICQYLILDIKFDINVREMFGFTPLHMSAMHGHEKTTLYLHGADLNATALAGITALHVAASSGNTMVMDLLINKGLDVNVTSQYGTPLREAVGSTNEKAVKFLLSKRADPNIVPDGSTSPLLSSIYVRSYKCAILLLRAGANPNTKSVEVSPLEIAVIMGQKKIVRSLLKEGADPDVKNVYGTTPLELAALNNKWDIFKKLFLKSFRIPRAIRDRREIFRKLFRKTSCIPEIHPWSLARVMKYCHSKKYAKKRLVKSEAVYSFCHTKADNAYVAQNYVKSLHYFNEALRANQDAYAALSKRSLCNTYLKDVIPALEDAIASQKLKSDWAEAYYAEGVARILVKQFDRAIESFEKALKLDPGNSVFQAALCQTLEKVYKISISPFGR